MNWIMDVIRRFSIVIGVMLAVVMAIIGFWTALIFLIVIAVISIVVATFKYIFTGDCDI